MTGIELTPTNRAFFRPEEGEIFSRFMNYVRHTEGISDHDSLNIIRENAFNILSRCSTLSVDGRNPSRRTNLHIGDVQSGKTLAMCSVIALAYDNNFRMVTILAGTKNILRSQSAERIQQVLRAIDEERKRFTIITQVADTAELRDRLLSLSQRKKYSAPRMLVLTLLKHQSSIARLTDSLETCNTKDSHIQTLILDDEADQASLNTSASSNRLPSTTYKEILRLKDNQPQASTLVQITATAQALFCISSDDPLSPDYVTISRRNNYYIGLTSYFSDKITEERFIRPVSDDEVSSDSEAEMPQSLKDSIEYFIVACALGRVLGLHGPFTLLCHPHSLQAEHERFKSWIARYRGQLREMLYEEELEDILFNQLYKFYLDATSLIESEIPSFNDLRIFIGSVIEEDINIRCINTDNPVPDIESFWENFDIHILVGGASIERGFTVEGILVTYLCRNPGSNADTIQQRARFCGYKSPTHFLLSRLWLDSVNLSFFRNYIVSEYSMRRRLEPFLDQQKPFLQAGFAIPLLQGYRPTRPNVHGALNTDRIAGWYSPNYPHFLSRQHQRDNLEFLIQLLTENITSFHQPVNTGWRCLESSEYRVSDLKEIVKRYHTCCTDSAGLALIGSILESYPLEYPDELPIAVYLLGDTTLSTNDITDNLSTLPPSVLQKRTVQSARLSSDSDDIRSFTVNLQRGRTTRLVADADIAHPTKITLHIGFFEFAYIKDGGPLDERQRIKSEVVIKQFEYGPTACVSLRLPELASWRLYRQ
jgi:hypothetical protein